MVCGGQHSAIATVRGFDALSAPPPKRTKAALESIPNMNRTKVITNLWAQTSARLLASRADGRASTRLKVGDALSGLIFMRVFS